MQRHKGFKLLVVLSFFSAACFLVFSCKSAPEAAVVEPLYLIEGDAAFVAYIPVEGNSEFVSHTLSALSGISEEDAETVAGRTSFVAVSSDLTGGFNAVASGNYPGFVLKSALSEKNGWERKNISFDDYSAEIFTSSDTGIQLFSPGSFSIAVADKISPVVERYKNESDVIYGIKPSSEISGRLDDETYKFLTGSEKNEIRFYSTVPSKIISKTLAQGKKIDLPLKNLRGCLYNSDAEKNFALVLELEFSNPSVIKAAVKMLKLALFPVPAKIEQISSSAIRISDISFSWRQMINMMI